MRERADVDAEYRAAGLEPVGPYTRVSDERECVCMTCGTKRRVKLATLRRGGVACRWCEGWAKWIPWFEHMAEVHKDAGWEGTPDDSLERLEWERLEPLTPVGTPHLPVGVRCRRCGETFVTVPERIHRDYAGWFGCPRCFQERKRTVRDDAPRLYAENGLELLEPCNGEHTQYRAACLACGSKRRVSYHELQTGSAPECWTCKTGIRADEPHRVYLVHFPALHVMKIGITHQLHDSRLREHEIAGGIVLDTVDVPSRRAARELEQLIRRRYRRWTCEALTRGDLPQGGWRETWRDDAPPLNLHEVLQEIASRD